MYIWAFTFLVSSILILQLLTGKPSPSGANGYSHQPSGGSWTSKNTEITLQAVKLFGLSALAQLISFSLMWIVMWDD